MSLEPADHHLLENLFTFPLNLRDSVQLIFVNSIHNSPKGTHCIWLTRMKEMMNTYSLGSFIYNNNIETMVQFTKKCRTTEAEGGKDLPIQKNY